MTKRSRRYSEAVAMLGESRPLPVTEAVGVLKKLKGAKFDETVELAVRLGIDPKQSDQQVRGSFVLPHGLGKEKSVIVFAEGAAAEEAKAAGAMEVGGAELAEKIQGGWLDFDVAIAAPDMMRHVGKLGRILGPQGKMPSPKSGTVTTQITAAVKEFRAGKIEYRADAGGIVHAPMGKKSFSAQMLSENVDAFLQHIAGQKPSSSKGIFLQKAHLTSTMGPSVELAT